MARTRGGGSSQEGRHEGRDEERAERRRPTASARRKRAGVCIAEEASIQVPEAVAEPQAQVEAVVEPEVEAPSDDGDEFGGGPRDPSLLISYADHVAHQLWMGEVFHIVIIIDKFVNLSLCMVMTNLLFMYAY